VLAGLIVVLAFVASWVSRHPAGRPSRTHDWLALVAALAWFVAWWATLVRRRRGKTAVAIEVEEYEHPNIAYWVWPSFTRGLLMLSAAAMPAAVGSLHPVHPLASVGVHLVVAVSFGVAVYRRPRVRLITVGCLALTLVPADLVNIFEWLEPIGAPPCPAALTAAIAACYGIALLGLVYVYGEHHRGMGMTENKQPVWAMFLLAALASAFSVYTWVFTEASHAPY